MKRRNRLILIAASVVFAAAGRAAAKEIMELGPAASFKAPSFPMPEVRWRMDSATIWQGLSQRNGRSDLPSLGTGFQAPLANVQLLAKIAPGIDLYSEWYLSSKHHPGQVTDREGYLLLSGLPPALDRYGLGKIFEFVNVKAGAFEPDFGDQHWTRSDNADVQRNPLIGNWLVDPNTTETGVEVVGRYGWVGALAGVGSGVTVDNFTAGRDYSRHFKLWLEPEDKRFRLAASAYRVDHARLDPAIGTKEGYESELFARNRSGSRYSGVVGQNPFDEDAAEAGQPAFGNGGNVTALQFDAAVKPLASLRLAGVYGIFRDADVNFADAGRPEEKWYYYGGEAVWDVSKSLYLAARYGGTTNKVLQGVPTAGRIERYQTGLGWRVMDGVLFKTEYVDQAYRGFDAAVPVLVPGGTAQIDYSGAPRFRGVMAEVSLVWGGTLFASKP